jgi:hypothetical protein
MKTRNVSKACEHAKIVMYVGVSRRCLKCLSTYRVYDYAAIVFCMGTCT